MKALVGRAAQLARRGHFAAGPLEARARDLGAGLRALLDAARRRQQRLRERCELLQVRPRRRRRRRPRPPGPRLTLPLPAAAGGGGRGGGVGLRAAGAAGLLGRRPRRGQRALPGQEAGRAAEGAAGLRRRPGEAGEVCCGFDGKKCATNFESDVKRFDRRADFYFEVAKSRRASV